MSLQESLEDYITHSEAKGKSEETLKHYRFLIEKFLEWLASETGVTEPEELQREQLERFQIVTGTNANYSDAYKTKDLWQLEAF